MLATGGSAVDAITQIKEHGGKKIKFMCIIAAPEGVQKLHEAHPDVQIYVGHLDRELNENATSVLDLAMRRPYLRYKITEKLTIRSYKVRYVKIIKNSSN